VFVANADPLPKDVNVVNTPDVNVVSMPSVEVTLPNALDVNVQNTPGVTIENGPTEPVPVIQSVPVRTPHQESDGGNFEPVDQALFDIAFLYTIPSPYSSGERFVMEMLTYEVVMDSDESLLKASLNISATPHKLTIPEPQIAGGKKYYSISIPLRLYVGAGNTVGLSFWKNFTGSQATASYTMSGYLISEDSPSLAP